MLRRGEFVICKILMFLCINVNNSPVVFNVSVVSGKHVAFQNAFIRAYDIRYNKCTLFSYLQNYIT